jgi:putative membrane protein
VAADYPFPNTTKVATLMHVIADSWGNDGHHGWFLLFPFFWLLAFFVCARFFFWRRGPRAWGYAGGRPRTDPREILAERYARGEISNEEYRERLTNLER